ncbi:UDP-N-acetylmuramate--L-alanine ligase [Candidatus Gottesmanbacteria bacterium]|nr:UDP-N-acetylmuramate--L-alanine ligase [Candidatus Gottesmanbacteria bacterium]
MEIDLQKIKRIHFVGIKGVAMASLAVWAKESGFGVSGSDVAEEFPSDDVLRRAKIRVLPGFDASHIKKTKPDLVIFTGAHEGRENIEVKAALASQIAVLPHGKALGEVMKGKRKVSVAGSHGKTTTTAMIATILATSGHDPSWAAGCGEIFGLGLPGHKGNGEWFVAEADEYVTDPHHDLTPRFLWQTPEVLVVINIDFDHPDVYRSLAEVTSAFVKLQSQQPALGVTVVNADDVASRALMGGMTEIMSYGFSPNADVRITNVGYGTERTFFTLAYRRSIVGEFALKVAGRHNVSNAAAAASCCRAIGISWEDIREGLLAFGGTKRRFESVGEVGGVRIYDDYAHHPKEIAATLAAARAWYPKERIIVIFQPHTYSRTKALFYEFAKSFRDADMVAIADIYASAREHETLGVSSQILVTEIAKHQPRVVYAKDYEKTAMYLRQHIRNGDVIIFMGAGDIYTWSRKFVNKFTK